LNSPDQDAGPCLPHSPEAERAYLGAIILGAEGPELDVSDFFLPFHQALYRSIRRLKQEEKPTDDLVLLSELLSPREIEHIGGISYLASLLDGLPRVSNLAHYAEIIKTKAAIRWRMVLCELMGKKLAAANGNAAEVFLEVSALSAPLREEVERKRILAFKSGVDLASASDQKIVWIAKGLVAKGAITELAAKVKTGKTTLLMEMVRAVLDGVTFLGLPTHKSPVVYLSEQPSVSFREAMERAKLLRRLDFLALLFSETRGLEWPQIAREAVAECKRVGASLMVVDTLPQFAGLTGDRENNSGDALEAMRPLQSAAAEGVGVVIIRHERKSGGDVGDSGRGSSAFAGAVDIVLSLRRPQGNSSKTRRLLHSLSRFSETPTDLLFDLTARGYVVLGDPGRTAIEDAKNSILVIAPQTEPEASDLRSLASRAEVSRRTAQRAVDELMRDRMLSRIGKGKKRNAFRYFKPENRFRSTPNIEGQKETNPNGQGGAQ
jgi:hypothetical protein